MSAGPLLPQSLSPLSPNPMSERWWGVEHVCGGVEREYPILHWADEPERGAGPRQAFECDACGDRYLFHEDRAVRSWKAMGHPWENHNDSCECHIGICMECGCTNEAGAGRASILNEESGPVAPVTVEPDE